MLAMQDSVTIKAYIFSNHPRRSNLLLGRGRTVKLVRTGNVFSGSVWGCEKPLHLNLQVVPSISHGFSYELGFKTTVEVPVEADNFPQWVAIHNQPGYASVLVPVNPRYRRPQRMWLLVRDYSHAEINESRQQCLAHCHLAFIDFMPRNAPPPPHNEEELLKAA